MKRRAALTLCVALTAGPAAAAFTPIRLTDPSLNPSPGNDFWITSAAAADPDRDGDLDLLVAGYFVTYDAGGRPRTVEDRLTLYRNDGRFDLWTWALTAVPLPTGGMALGASDVAWADDDRDGDVDAVVAGVGTMAIYRNDGGALTRTDTALPAYWEDADPATLDLASVTWADWDNDGDADLLVPSVMEDFAYAPLHLLRNDGGVFTDVSADFPMVSNGVTAWADRDRDGDLDLLAANFSTWSPPLLDLFRNDGHVFAPVATDLARLAAGMAGWCDVEPDGDLDVVVAGQTIAGEPEARILVDDSHGGWTVRTIAANDGWVRFSGVACADLDSDGQADLLLSGAGADSGRAVVYRNDGGVFTASDDRLPAPVAGPASGAHAWFDLDGDGDLDYFLAGGYLGADGVTVEARTQVFRNEAPANAAPSVPAGLQAAVDGARVTLAWTGSSDDSTPAAALTYELEITGAGQSSAPACALPQPGNVSGDLSWTVGDLPGGAYAWSVRALDAAFAASAKATGSFTIALTGVPDQPDAGALALSPVWPNPQRRGGPPARFALTLPNARPVTIAVFDVRGRLAARLHDGPLAGGSHTFDLGTADLPSGTYLVRATAGGAIVTRRATVVR